MCIFISGISIAQRALDKGSVAVLGGINFLSTKADGADASRNTFAITPGIMYNIIDQLGIGTTVVFTSTTFDGNNILRELYLGPYIRYTFSRDLPFFADFQYSFGSEKSGNQDAVFASNIKPSLGYSIFLDKTGTATLEPNFYFLHRRLDGNARDNTIGLGINFVWNFINISGK